MASRSNRLGALSRNERAHKIGKLSTSDSNNNNYDPAVKYQVNEDSAGYLRPYHAPLIRPILSESQNTSLIFDSRPLSVPLKNRRTSLKPARVNSLRSATEDENVDGKVADKKRVSFAPSVINYERETKKPLKRQVMMMPTNGIGSGAVTDDIFDYSNCGYFVPPSREVVMCHSPVASRDPSKSNVKWLSDGREIEENHFVSFTHVWNCPVHYFKTVDEKCAERIKRIHQLMGDLEDAHNLYNLLPIDVQHTFLQEEIIPRYVMSLDLCLTEGYLGFGIQITNTIYETTRFLQSSLYNEFFHSDYSPKLLPMIVQQDGDDYITKVSPIINCLNKICGNKSRHDVSYMSKETVLVKLQLELTAISLIPVKSMMFRCLLGILPGTASTAHELLVKTESANYLKWVNNSEMRKMYMLCLLNIGLVDEFGAKGVLPAPSISSLYAQTRKHAHENGSPQQPRQRSNNTSTIRFPT